MRRDPRSLPRALARSVERKGSRITRNAHVALRAERAIASRRIAVMRGQTALMAAAGAVAVIGVAMLNVALFLWLEPGQGGPGAAAIAAGVDVALAALVALVATRMSAEAELAPLVEVRDLALEEIEADLSEAAGEARQAAADLRRMAADPLGAGAASLLGPALSMLIKTMRK